MVDGVLVGVWEAGVLVLGGKEVVVWAGVGVGRGVEGHDQLKNWKVQSSEQLT